jgi:hypothetical protein
LCGTITCTPASGDSFPVGVTTVTCSDQSTGSVCIFTVTVKDIEKPILTCPTGFSLSIGGDVITTIPDYTSYVKYSDNCNTAPSSVADGYLASGFIGSNHIHQGPVPGGQVKDVLDLFVQEGLSDGKSLPIYMTAYDDAGNFGRCTIDVTITQPCGMCGVNMGTAMPLTLGALTAMRLSRPRRRKTWRN